MPLSVIILSSGYEYLAVGKQNDCVVIAGRHHSPCRAESPCAGIIQLGRVKMTADVASPGQQNSAVGQQGRRLTTTDRYHIPCSAEQSGRGVIQLGCLQGFPS